MQRPNEDETQAISQTAIHYTKVLTYIERCYRHELESLPFATTNTEVAKGRCQVLGEIMKLLQSARQQNQSR